MNRIKDLTNSRFGRLLVIKYAYSRRKKVYWECLCDCGNIKEIQGTDLKSGKTLSCGCLHKEVLSKRVKHGYARRFNQNDPLYVAWKNMKLRCLNHSFSGWKDYGGRGIKVCERWLNSFENFAFDMGEHPGKGYSLERIDNNGNYTPENCKWATRTEQGRNRRANTLLTYQGETLPISAWAERIGVKENTIFSRLRYGWSIEETLSKPARSHKEYSYK